MKVFLTTVVGVVLLSAIAAPAFFHLKGTGEQRYDIYRVESDGETVLLYSGVTNPHRVSGILIFDLDGGNYHLRGDFVIKYSTDLQTVVMP